MLPYQIFFRPKMAFFSLLDSLDVKNIIDVGCGVGDLVERINKRGHQTAIGIDVIEREGRRYDEPILITDATEFDYPSNSVVMICRPCSGGFVEQMVDYLSDKDVDGIIVVTNHDNYVEGLDFHRIADDMGEDGESVWVKGKIIDEAKDLKVFKKIKTSFWKHPTWREVDCDRLVNVSGGWMPWSDDIVVLDERTTFWFDMLDWRDCGILSESSVLGWLSPEAEFFRCEYYGHNDLVEFIIKANLNDIEHLGWIKVTLGYDNQGRDAFLPHMLDDKFPKPTKKQIQWLRREGLIER